MKAQTMNERTSCAVVLLCVALQVPAQWTWIGGSDLSNAAPVFGTKGVFDPAVVPGAIYAPGQCVDLNGRLWLFGGKLGGGSNDLWCFDPTLEQWAWMGGGQGLSWAGHYGIKGMSSPDNLPRGRGYAPAMWCDAVGDLWLFGGQSGDEYNDLWKYEMTNGSWTWMHGDSTGLSTGSYGIIGVADPSNEPPCRSEIIGTWVGSDGSFWMFGGERYPFYTYSDMWRYDPLSDQWTWMQGVSGAPGGPVSYGTLNVPSATNTPGKRCSWTHWTDANNRFWLFGGMTHGQNLPSNDLWMFDPMTLLWTWKGGPTTLADLGSFTGQCSSGMGANPPAMFEATANWKDSVGRFYLYGGGYRNGTPGNQPYEDVWRYDPVVEEWTWLWGSGMLNETSDHGTLGVAAPTNTPGGRFGSVAVAKGDSVVYHFGGFTPFVANDLWKLDMTQLCVSTGVERTVGLPTLWYDGQGGRVHLRSAEAATAVRVHDAAGRLCLAEKPVGGSGSDRSVDVSGLGPGLYIASVILPSGAIRAQSFRFFVE
ncbi:MAG: hypothetical protein IPN85_04600 [Flavobacteriales bacterium]|nr:hypothetical protein [Flavobacteriales bacterium]MBK9287574.1 hypothetical protein [Flavobacteriales bacterium]MBL0037264.1 hypothetical protein [Flavobacteriales bacterium]